MRSQSHKYNTVLIVLLVRNKEHTLPYFLTQLEKLDYPKQRLSLFIRSDCNIDKTLQILETWINHIGNTYHSLDIRMHKTVCIDDENNAVKWTTERFDHVINFKNEAFRKGRNMWADYIWFLDVDVFLVNTNILSNLIEKKKHIVAPMLNSLGTYSNFWCGMTQNYWYKRTEEYFPILDRKKIGCFAVPMIHSCVLVDLKVILSDKLSFNPKDIYDYDGPTDDIIVFAIGANNIGLELNICNDVGYAIIPPPLNEEDSISKDFQQIIDVKLRILIEHPPISVLQSLSSYVPSFPKKDMLGFDNIYLINLTRRFKRRERMHNSLMELGLYYEVFNAVDGKTLNESYLQQLGMKQLPVYKDPWWNRDMTYGEIGCFLSHYFIWEDIVNNSYEKVIIFEDDIEFEPYFRDKVKYLVNQANQLQLNWDLIYFGRKKLKDNEPWVDGSDILRHVEYSYWTLCYIITLNGAKKLLHPKPLQKMVPVDEYLPIMFNKHPQSNWMENYNPRNLKAYSASPLLVYPTHYTDDKGYVSDTEYSSEHSRETRPSIHNTVIVPSDAAN